MKTLVVGCTGMVGSWVVDALLKKGQTVRCMSRSWNRISSLPEGMERIAADLDRPHTLADAFKGADNVFLLVPVGTNETDQGLNALRAAKSAGVKKVVYLSTYMPPGSDSIPFFKNKIPVEESVRGSGIEYTILRPNNFYQNDALIIGVVTGYGIYPTPLGSIGLNRIDVRDVADCAVAALTGSGFGGTYALHGPNALNGADIAAIYSKHVGRRVRYAGDDLDVWVRHVRKIMPAWLYGNLRTMYRYLQLNGMKAPEADLERQSLILGRNPRSFETFAGELSREWRRALAWAV
jgi:uncharacterized protein YbjT (DUF2867 family)